jgi:hypothetical protein
MPAPNNTTAQAQLDIMLQRVEQDIELSQNMDEGVDRMFQMVTAKDMGIEKYRHPIQTDVGGQVGGYNPDGGSYFQGTGPQYQQFIVVPSCNMIAFGATELLERLEGPGSEGLEAVKPISRMMTKIKGKMAHFRNALAQGYNEGELAVVDATYVGGTTVQLSNVPFGNRLLDLYNTYQVTDNAYNVLGQATVLSKSNSTAGGVDTVQLDNVPAGFAAGSFFIPINYASGAPLGPQGLQYIISDSTSGDNGGIPRSNPVVQSAAVNASSTLTLGIITVMDQRQNQLLGSDQAGQKRSYYTHEAQRMTCTLLGFAKTALFSTDGKVKMFDIAPSKDSMWMIGGQKVETDSMAAIDKLYNIATMQLRKVRYPGSQKMIPFAGGGLWWPRMNGGQWTSEKDTLFQDCYNLYTKLPWAHSFTYNLFLNPVNASGN